MKIPARIKQTRFYKNLKIVLKKSYPLFEDLAFFLDNSRKNDTVCFILAGYKPFTWEIIFKRIKKFIPADIDVCIVSSGIFSEELYKRAKENNWSYISLKRNCVTQALNSAIRAFPSARYLYKLDEDIFITKGFFENLKSIHDLSKQDYFPCFTAPLIPVNGYGYRQILEKLNLVEEYSKRFEYPKISAGQHMMIENNPETAMFFWGKGSVVPQLDALNKNIQMLGGGSYSVCPIRFSIGAIYFERQTLENAGWFPVHKGTCMGSDEVFLCNLASTNSKAMIIAQNQVAGHLSFGKQNEAMKEYFLNNTALFDIGAENA